MSEASAGAPSRTRKSAQAFRTISEAAVSSRKSMAREAISLVRGSSDPVLAASSTSSRSSSGDSRASEKLVLSPNRRSTRFDDAVRVQTTGRAT